jgi:hypothetical protein
VTPSVTLATPGLRFHTFNRETHVFFFWILVGNLHDHLLLPVDEIATGCTTGCKGKLYDKHTHPKKEQIRRDIGIIVTKRVKYDAVQVIIGLRHYEEFQVATQQHKWMPPQTQFCVKLSRLAKVPEDARQFSRQVVRRSQNEYKTWGHVLDV